MSEHTPEPWFVMGPSGTDRTIDIEDADQNILVRVYPSDKNRSLPSEANARLIAAAPDLLAKCIKVRDYFLRLAERSEHNAQVSDFPTYGEACKADAKNWRTTARDIETVIAKAEEGSE